MYGEFYASLSEPLQPLTASAVKTNRLAVAQLEKLVEFQLSALQAYLDLGMKQLKAAATISSLQELPGFFASQIEAAGAMQQKLLDDAQTLFDLGNGFRAEFDRLAEDNLNEMTARTAAATQEVADKAA